MASGTNDDDGLFHTFGYTALRSGSVGVQLRAGIGPYAPRDACCTLGVTMPDVSGTPDARGSVPRPKPHILIKKNMHEQSYGLDRYRTNDVPTHY